MRFWDFDALHIVLVSILEYFISSKQWNFLFTFQKLRCIFIGHFCYVKSDKKIRWSKDKATPIHQYFLCMVYYNPRYYEISRLPIVGNKFHNTFSKKIVNVFKFLRHYTNINFQKYIYTLEYMASLKCDSNVAEDFCQIKLFPSLNSKNTNICLVRILR